MSKTSFQRGPINGVCWDPCWDNLASFWEPVVGAISGIVVGPLLVVVWSWSGSKFEPKRRTHANRMDFQN